MSWHYQCYSSAYFFHDDYGGGEYFFNIHLGFPFSWRDGSLDFGPAVQQGIPLEEYMALHPEEIYWRIDFPALIADLFFWANLGILMTTLYRGTAQLWQKLR